MFLEEVSPERTYSSIMGIINIEHAFLVLQFLHYELECVKLFL